MEVNDQTLDILLHKVKKDKVVITNRIKQKYESIDEDRLMFDDLSQIEMFIYDAIDKANNKEVDNVK